MSQDKKPLVTRNFMKQLSRGVVKSIPLGALLEQVIYGTLDGEGAQKEAAKLHFALSKISQELEGQDVTLGDVLGTLENQVRFSQEIAAEMDKFTALLKDPDHAPIPEGLERALERVIQQNDEQTETFTGEMNEIKALLSRFIEKTELKDSPAEKKSKSFTPSTPHVEFCYAETLEQAREYFQNSRWRKHPVLDCPRAYIYHPSNLISKNHGKLTLHEAAHIHSHAVIKGGKYCGKTSAICHIAEEFLNSAYELPKIPLIIDLSSISDSFSNHPLDSFAELITAVGDPDIQNRLESIESAWINGRLWLILDHCEKLLPAIHTWLSSLKRNKNHIWLVCRSDQDKNLTVQPPERYVSLNIQPPILSDIFDEYLNRLKPLIEKRWQPFLEFYMQWVSTMDGPLPHEFFLINLALKIYMEPKGRPIEKMVELWAVEYLHTILFESMQPEDLIRRINTYMTRILAEVIDRERPEDFIDAMDVIPEKIIDRVRRPEGLPLDFQFSRFIYDNYDRIITDSILLRYWISCAIELVFENHRMDGKIYQLLTRLLKNEAHHDLGVFCLNRLIIKPDFDIDRIITELSAWKAVQDQIICVTVYWRILPHMIKSRTFDSDTIKIVILELNSAMDRHPDPWSEIKILRAANRALDALSAEGIALPPLLCELVLRDSDQMRYDLVKDIFFETPRDFFFKHINVGAIGYDEHIFELLEQYPNKKTVEYLIDVCFDYSLSLDSGVVKKILSRFKVFRRIAQSKNINSERNRWIETLQTKPDSLYQRDHQRTDTLFEWLAEDPSCRFHHEEVEKLYNFGKSRFDNRFRRFSIQSLAPRQGNEQWLNEMYHEESALEVKKEIIVKLVELKALPALQSLLSNQSIQIQAFTIAEWFCMHPETIHDDQCGMLPTGVLNIDVLDKLTEDLDSNFVKKHLVMKYMQIRGRLLTRKEAVILVRLCNQNEIIDKAIDGLQQIDDCQKFIEATYREWDDCLYMLESLRCRASFNCLSPFINKCISQIKEINNG